MKKEIKFNHDEDSLTEALGINQSPDEIMDMITKTIILWSEDDRGSMTSILSEYIHKILPYEVILSIATKAVQDTLKESMLENPLDKIIEDIEKIIKYGVDKDDIERKIRGN